nr:unnamed protein product [Callosobruchus analis]
MVIYCCYCSPNIPFSEYEKFIEALWEDLLVQGKKAILLGDLNAKAVDWGSPVTDRRGAALCEWLAASNMVVVNDGLQPTFCRHNSCSFIDVTFATQSISRQIQKWQVLETESMSHLLRNKNEYNKQKTSPRTSNAFHRHEESEKYASR